MKIIRAHPRSNVPPTEAPESKYLVELSADELVRIWMLSYSSEGSPKYPDSERDRLHGTVPKELADVGQARLDDPNYRHPQYN